MKFQGFPNMDKEYFGINDSVLMQSAKSNLSKEQNEQSQ